MTWLIVLIWKITYLWWFDELEKCQKEINFCVLIGQSNEIQILNWKTKENNLFDIQREREKRENEKVKVKKNKRKEQNERKTDEIFTSNVNVARCCLGNRIKRINGNANSWPKWWLNNNQSWKANQRANLITLNCFVVLFSLQTGRNRFAKIKLIKFRLKQLPY